MALLFGGGPYSALAAAVTVARGRPDPRVWGPSQELAASTVDAIRFLTYALIAINTPKGKPRPKPPVALPRPGADGPRVVRLAELPIAAPAATEPARALSGDPFLDYVRRKGAGKR